MTLVTLLGLGTLFLSLSRDYSRAVEALLFGEILGVGDSEVLPVAVISTGVLLGIIIGFRPLLMSSMSPDLSRARGISPDVMDMVFLSILAATTAMALPVVGALLVFSLMVGPASAARALTSRPFPAMLLSICLALLTVWAAIAMSYLTSWPIGFFVGAFTATCYVLGRMWSWAAALFMRRLSRA